MNEVKFNQDFDLYKSNISKKLNESQVNLMLHAYCMAYCDLAQNVFSEKDVYIDLDPVLEKISELNPLVSSNFL